MCGIFGILSYKNKLKDIDALADTLAVESAQRGTDATGVAYVHDGVIKVNKKAVSAYKFEPNVPKFAKAVIGHTRHSTQGDKSKNYNNHPWSQKVSNCSFALAHNGVLFNDGELQRKYKFSSKIQTDSFVAVQLLRLRNRLDFDSLRFMAESLEGSYSFNIVDNHNNIYIVKGDSPVSLIHFYEVGVYVFASTDQILWKALVDSELFGELQKGAYDELLLEEGDIVKITRDGEFETEKFKYTEFFGRRWYEYGMYDEDMFHSKSSTSYLDDIKSVAAMCGEDPEVIQELYDSGFTLSELEEMVYCGEI